MESKQDPAAIPEFPNKRPEGMDFEMYRGLRKLHNERIKIQLRGELDKERSVEPKEQPKPYKALSGDLKHNAPQRKVKALCVPSAEEDVVEDLKEMSHSFFYKTYKSILQWLRDRSNLE